jgi:hypothetical protein
MYKPMTMAASIDVAVIRNAIPTDLTDNVATPNGNKKPSPSALLPKLNEFLLDYVEKYGKPIAFAREKNGALIQDIYPMREDEKIQISSSSSVVLQMHTETAFHKYKPDWVVLACVKGDKKAETLYATLDEILRNLDEKTIWDLRQPEFLTTIDPSFLRSGEKDREIVVRPISGFGANKWNLIYDADLMKGMTDQASSALKKLGIAIAKSTRSVVLNTGDVLVINNRVAIHGRRPFKARYDGTDRWLKRVLVRETMPPRSAMKGFVVVSEA